MNADVHISIANRCDDDLIEAARRLIPQLAPDARPPERRELDRIIASGSTHLFVAQIDGRIVGLLTLALFRIPTGIRAWIEDVVVDESARGRGIGERLTRAAIDKAVSLGAESIDLTSRPNREAANRLYLRLGFEPRETNVYRMSLRR